VTAAVILAAGPGTRLGALGARLPKTMIPVAGRPYLEHLTGRLLGAGLHPVIVAVHHHAATIMDHFSGHPLSPGLRFVHTDQAGTGADLSRCLDALPAGAFLVWNGDTIVDLDISNLLTPGQQRPHAGTIVLTRRPDVPNHNAWYVDHDATVLATAESDPPPTPPAAYAWRGSSTGVLLPTTHLLAPHASAPVPDRYRAILPALIRQGALTAYDNGHRYFLDFGTPTALASIDHNQVTDWYTPPAAG
jgi:mannose-1-phosphate guanylyltransferase